MRKLLITIFLYIFVALPSLLSAKILFLAGPPGVGKSIYIDLLKKADHTLQKAISHTTRAPRSNEKEGQDYYYVSQDEFNALKKADAFLFSTEEFGKSYGLTYQEVETANNKDTIVITDISAASIKKVKEASGDDAYLVFLVTSSYQDLQDRLYHRAQQTGESEEDLEKLLEYALKTLVNEQECDVFIVANDIDETMQRLQGVINYMKSDDPAALARVRTKDIPQKKFEKYNIPETIRFQFSPHSFQEFNTLLHTYSIPPLVFDFYNYDRDTPDIQLMEEFPHLLTWDPEHRFFIQHSPIYTKKELMTPKNLPFLKYSEYGIHLLLWTLYHPQMKNSFLESVLFGTDNPKRQKAMTFQDVEVRGIPYLISLLDVTADDLPLLRSMRASAYENLTFYNINKNDTVEMYFHFPYAPKTLSLHLHVRANQQGHPLEYARSITLEEVMEGLERDLTIEEIILAHQEKYGGYIYSDIATSVLPKMVPSIITEMAPNPFRL